ncbi:hypothetical protein CRYUN_Cryun29cG0100400 [Craigia yunnanensis]
MAFAHKHNPFGISTAQICTPHEKKSFYSYLPEGVLVALDYRFGTRSIHFSMMETLLVVLLNGP